MSVDQLLRVIQSGSIAAVLALFIVSGFLGQWVFGPIYKAMVQDRDEWKAMALAATAISKNQAEQIAALTEVTEQLTQALGRRTTR
jgi:fucose 4-O-acetylase-like acetyltransferase